MEKLPLSDQIQASIREVKDFPKQGIYFKDITPVLKDAKLVAAIVDALYAAALPLQPEVIAGVESRGFWFGMLLAQRLGLPFVPIRKLGKLPYDTQSYTYELEYGKATMEIHTDALRKGQRVLIHDDLLATGGTAGAAAELVRMQGAQVVGFAFVVNLSFLSGMDKLKKYSENIIALTTY